MSDSAIGETLGRAAETAAPKQGVRFKRPSRRQIVAFSVHFITGLGTVAALGRGYLYGVSWAEIGLFVFFYMLTMTGLVVGYHRLFTHTSFKTGKAMRFILAALGAMTVQGPVLTWVADHNRHHALSDVEGDLHSPNLHGRDFLGRWRGFWHSHIGWMFSMTETPWNRHVLNLMKDQPVFWVHRNYWLCVFVGQLVPTLAGWAIIGGWQGALSGLLWGGLMRVFMLNHVVLSIGSICHMWGGRPFKARTKDYSANNWFVSLVSHGDGNQNNHHAFPTSAMHGIRWWQPDGAYFVIRILAALGLVWDVRVPSKDDIARALRG